ncbi:MAG: FKBP-type peptidyl-prolyl cis-trans isomerase [Candidatus Omnitrophica bacterium]|nr:FKBP-type peptidyl-prolyl cis-trans isomerase [Candidatus Omnitrophota bacterium]
MPVVGNLKWPEKKAGELEADRVTTAKHAREELMRLIVCVSTFFFLLPATVDAADPVLDLFPLLVVREGVTVSLRCALYTEDGVLLDSNMSYAEQPLACVVGRRRLLAGIENALIGMRAGDEKQLFLLPEQAFGPRQESLVREVSRSAVPEGEYLRGDYLIGVDGAGMLVRGKVREIRNGGQKLLVDFNHPGAGKVIKVQVKVERIDQPPEPADVQE